MGKDRKSDNINFDKGDKSPAMNSPELTIIEENDGYLILWCIFNEDSDVVKKYNVFGDISLPYFVFGEDMKKLNNGEEIELKDTSLLIGLILRYHATPPMTVTHKIKPYFRDILNSLLRQGGLIEA